MQHRSERDPLLHRLPEPVALDATLEFLHSHHLDVRCPSPRWRTSYSDAENQVAARGTRSTNAVATCLYAVLVRAAESNDKEEVWPRVSIEVCVTMVVNLVGGACR